MSDTNTVTVTGTLELHPATEVILNLPAGRGPWVVTRVRAVRVLRTFKDEIGMTRTEVQVEPVR